MHIRAAQLLKSEFLSEAQATIDRLCGKQSFLQWLGSVLGRGSARSSEATISVGVSLGATAEDSGISIRSTLPLDPLETHFLRRLRDRTGRIDLKIIEPVRPEQAVQETGPMDEPPRIGSRVRHEAGGPGTLGAFVRRPGSARLCILSNNHVLANLNTPVANARTFFEWTQGSDKYREIGKLIKYVTLRDGAQVNFVDAAISEINQPIPDVGDVGGRIRLTGNISLPDRRTPVFKFGNKTGFTEGVIASRDHDQLKLSYGGVICRFDDQIEIEPVGPRPFSAEGDSGSLVVNANGDAVGLLMGGAKVGGSSLKLSYANPIKSVLEALGVVLVAG